MEIKTYRASSPTAAMKIAAIEHGDDVLVINTKQIQKKTLNKEELWEVTVGIEDNKKTDEKEAVAPAPITPKPSINSTVNPYGNSKDDEVSIDFSARAKEISRMANMSNSPSSTPKTKQSTQSTNSDKELKEIKKDINKIEDQIKLFQDIMWQQNAGTRSSNTIIPSEFAEIYRLAKESQMDEEHLDGIMQMTLEHMPQKMRGSSDSIKRYFQVLLRKMIPVKLEPEAQNGEKKVIMFVGPTGVGKTTTMAKLAARYSYLREKREKVGIITLDTYRIGAVDQVAYYARMMKAPLESVVEPEDFNEALNKLSHCDVILIDTMGSSQYDTKKINKLNKFLELSTEEIEVNLVLSAGSRLEDMNDIFKNFAPLNIQSLVFTKFDETRAFGPVFSLIYNTSTPVSYYSVGQDVPDDLEVASGEFLVECMLDGFNRKEDDA